MEVVDRELSPFDSMFLAAKTQISNSIDAHASAVKDEVKKMFFGEVFFARSVGQRRRREREKLARAMRQSFLSERELV